MHFRTIAALTSSAFLLSACASIIEGSTDQVNIVSPISVPMTCNATNERGSWVGNMPGQVTVKKSRTDLNLACQDPRTGMQANGKLVSEVEPWAFGNILLGGIIGLGVDWGTGAAYDYPENVTVTSAAAPLPVTYAPATPVPAPAVVPAVPATPVIAPAPAITPTNSSIQYYAPATPVVVEPTPTPTIAPLPFGGPTPPPAY